MASFPVSPALTVAQALLLNESASAVFVNRRTACVGCTLARFCTLEDVAKTYGLPLQELLEALEEVAHADQRV